MGRRAEGAVRAARGWPAKTVAAMAFVLGKRTVLMENVEAMAALAVAAERAGAAAVLHQC